MLKNNTSEMIKKKINENHRWYEDNKSNDHDKKGWLVCMVSTRDINTKQSDDFQSRALGIRR